MRIAESLPELDNPEICEVHSRLLRRFECFACMGEGCVPRLSEYVPCPECEGDGYVLECEACRQKKSSEN